MRGKKIIGVALSTGIAFAVIWVLAATPDGKTVAISVTEKGFEPSTITVKHGEPVTLVVTRTTDKTCAKEIVIDDEKLKATLPLNEAIRLTFTPKKSGDIKFACGMNMIEGVLKVE